MNHSTKLHWPRIFFSSASRPFGMVNLSPDTRTGDNWMNGYLYGDTKVRCFSQIRGWQLYGLAVLPVTGEMRGHLGMDTYASEFSHDDEVVRAGHHRLILRTYVLSGQPALVSGPRVGAFVTFAPTPRQAVSLKVALSYTSEAGARRNLAAELAHGDFDRLARESRDDWNPCLGRIEVAGGTEAQRTKFYTDLWHALLGNRIVSDADGRYCDMTRDHPVIRRARLDDQGRPLYAHHNFEDLPLPVSSTHSRRRMLHCAVALAPKFAVAMNRQL